MDPQRPIIVVDGKDLVLSCIENEIGFIFNPQFSESAMREFINKNNPLDRQPENDIEVEKTISTNDIRARILRIPRPILDVLDKDCEQYDVTVNDEHNVNMRIDKSRTYFAGVTETYKRLGLLESDGSFHIANAIWTYCNGQVSIEIELIN